MIHSAAREIQATGIGAQRGEVLVPRLIGIETQGALSCGAAPLVAGSLVRRGCQVRLAPVPRCDNPAGDGDAIVVLATWQEDGRTGAIAAATAPQDKLAAAHARAAVEEWAAAASPRTLLAAPSPWCSGAVHALEACRRAAAANTGTGHTVRLLAPVPMPPESAAELAELGAVEVTSLAGAQPGDVIVIPAHGVATEIKVEAAERRLTVVDATCPLVAGAQDKAARLAERGQHIALISQPGAAATGPIASRAAGRVTVVETPAGPAPSARPTRGRCPTWSSPACRSRRPAASSAPCGPGTRRPGIRYRAAPATSHPTGRLRSARSRRAATSCCS